MSRIFITSALTSICFLFGLFTASAQSGLSVNGNNQSANFGQMNALSQSITVEAWIRPNGDVGVTTWDRFIDAHWQQNFALTSQHNNINSLNLAIAGTGTVVTVDSVIVPNEWQHIAFTYNHLTGFARLFRNGQFLAQGTFNHTGFRNVTSNVLAGASNSSASEGFNGLLDNVRLWSVARTDAEILANFDACLNGNEPGLVAFYDFENVTGNSIPNRVGANNTGTLQNGAFIGVGTGVLPTITSTTPATIFGSGSTDVSAVASSGEVRWYASESGGAVLHTGSTFTTSNLTETTSYWAEAVDNGCVSEERTEVVVTVSNSAAIAFDGVDDYVTINSGTFTEYTIEAWVKLTGSAVNKNILCFTAGDPTSSWSHQIRTNASGNFVHYTFDGGQKTVTGSTAVSLGVWYHIAITAKNGNVSRLYVNGVEEGTAQSISTLWTGGSSFSIGRNSGGPAGFLEGAIDEIRIWNVVRTQSELETNKDDCVIPENEADLVAYYQCEDRAGTTVTDLKGSYNGTLVNGPTWVASGFDCTPPCVAPTITSTTSATIFGSGSTDISAVASEGEVSWYATESGGAILHTGSTFTTPNLTETTSFWAEAVDGACVSSSRTEVVVTIEPIPELISWSANAPDGNWQRGAAGVRWTPGDFEDAPPLTTLLFDNNHELEINNNVTGNNSIYRLIFGENATQSRTISGGTFSFTRPTINHPGAQLVNNTGTKLIINSNLAINNTGPSTFPELITQNGSIELNGTYATLDRSFVISGNGVLSPDNYVEVKGNGTGNFTIMNGGILKTYADNNFPNRVNNVIDGELHLMGVVNNVTIGSASIKLGHGGGSGSAKLYFPKEDGGQWLNWQPTIISGTAEKVIGSLNTSGVNTLSMNGRSNISDSFTIDVPSENGIFEMTSPDNSGALRLNASFTITKKGQGKAVLSYSNNTAYSLAINEGTVALARPHQNTIHVNGNVNVSAGAAIQISASGQLSLNNLTINEGKLIIDEGLVFSLPNGINGNDIELEINGFCTLSNTPLSRISKIRVGPNGRLTLHDWDAVSDLDIEVEGELHFFKDGTINFPGNVTLTPNSYFGYLNVSCSNFIIDGEILVTKKFHTNPNIKIGANGHLILAGNEIEHAFSGAPRAIISTHSSAILEFRNTQPYTFNYELNEHAGNDFTNIIINNSAPVTLNMVKNIDNLTLLNGVVSFDMHHIGNWNNTLLIKDNVTNGNGKIDASNYTITYNKPTGTQSIGKGDYLNLNFTGGSKVMPNDTVSISGVWNHNDAAVNVNLAQGFINYTNSDRVISALTSPYHGLIITGTNASLSGSISANRLHLNQPLRLNQNHLTLLGAISGESALIGDDEAQLSFEGANDLGILKMDNSTPGSSDVLKTLVFNGVGSEAELTLGSPITVIDEATINNAILKTCVNKLVMGSAATLTESPTGYVIGNVEATHPLTAATNKNFNNIGIHISPVGNMGETTVTRYTCAGIESFGETSMNRTFIVSPENNGPANVTFFYRDSEIGQRTEDNLKLFKSPNGEEGSWELLTDNFTLNKAENYISCSVTGFSQITAHDELTFSQGPLPIELLSFKGLATPNGNLISWQTASETNNHFFDIEVANPTDFSFRKVASILGAGNSTRMLDYNYLHTTTNQDGSWYKLKQVDFDGTFKYYGPIWVEPNNLNDFTVLKVQQFTNSAVFTLSTVNENYPVQVDVIDSQGRIIKSFIKDVESGITQVNLEINARGLWIVQFTQNQKRITHKLVN
jgi:hypothetical protein